MVHLVPAKHHYAGHWRKKSPYGFRERMPAFWQYPFSWDPGLTLQVFDNKNR
jgi:hypothetical protein